MIAKITKIFGYHLSNFRYFFKANLKFKNIIRARLWEVVNFASNFS